jgi:hypothetical protein
MALKESERSSPQVRGAFGFYASGPPVSNSIIGLNASEQQKSGLTAAFFLRFEKRAHYRNTIGSQVARLGKTRRTTMPSICKPMNCIMPA